MTQTVNEGDSSAPRSRMLLRGESAIASIGLALAVILVGTMAASTWWAVRSQQHAKHKAEARRMKDVAALLAGSAESMLTAEELSPLRRLIIDTAQRHDLEECRIVLPDGSIIADAHPAHITIHALPQAWPDGKPRYTTARLVTRDAFDLRYPLEVKGRGSAELQLSGRIELSTAPLWQSQTNLMLIGTAAMLALLLVYRHSRSRLQAMGAIRESLLAIERGESTAAALQVNAALGAEAEAWNEILAEKHALRKSVLADKARESLVDRRRSGGGDLQKAIDVLAQGMILLDEHLRVKFCNGAATVFLQHRREQILDRDIREVILNTDVAHRLQSWIKGGAVGRETFESDRGESDSDGVLRWQFRPMRKDDAASTMIIIEDITQQRVAEEARHTFVAQATHELRTPLTNIRLYVETALEDGESDPAAMANCLNVINSESRRLERIVSDLLSTAEIEAGSLKLQTDDVHLREVFDQLAADYAAQAKEKRTELTFNLPPKLPVIQADRDKLTLALHNLVGNALKYTPDGGTVTVNVEVDGKGLSVDVIDSGIGIAPTDQQQIFDRFYRAQDRRVADITGSGLGLALAREVIRMHGGHIAVQSEIDKGSTFTLTLPLNDAA